MDRVKALEEYVKTLLTPSAILDMFYPVGSYYETSDTDFDPEEEWGGEWSLESGGKFHLSAGGSYTAGSTGGSANAIIPNHRHSVSITSGSGTSHSHGAGDSTYRFLRIDGTGIGRDNVAKGSTTPHKYIYSDVVVGSTTSTGSESSHTHSISGNTGYEGESGTGANMPPYIVVNRWHRTG